MNPEGKSKRLLTVLGAILITFLLLYQVKLREPEIAEPADAAKPLNNTRGPLANSGKIEPCGDANPCTAPRAPAESIVVQSAKPLSSPVDTDGPPAYAMKPVDGVVEFEVQEGYAVAFGDLVLGKPPVDFDQPRGLAEVARPNLWIRGEVPYMIQPDVLNSDRIQAAIQMFHQSTGLKFVPHTDQPDAIAFTQSDEHCSSYLGRVGGLQPIFISEKCTPTDIAHEMMHALGFVHEQSRTDRDAFISIEWDNIQTKYQNQFAMVPEPLMEVFGGSAFDPNSILMYGRTAFAIDPKKPTLKLKSGVEVHLAPKGLSELDVERVNRLYRE